MVAFTDSLSGNSKGYADLEKYKTEAQNLGMFVSIWILDWIGQSSKPANNSSFYPRATAQQPLGAVEIPSNPEAEL